MKKSTARWWIALAVVFVVYNVIVFAVPFAKTPVFFLSWGFTLIAIAVQIYNIRTAFYHGEGTKSKFYGFPVVKIGVGYWLAQTVLGLLFMVLGRVVQLWIPLVVYVVILGVSAVGFIAADAVRDEVVRQDVELKKDVVRMRALQSKAISMVPLAQDYQVRKALEKFAEDLRFSDPVSNVALEAVEADLASCVDALQQAVLDHDSEAALSLKEKAEMILAERNRLCKLEKWVAH